MITIIALILTIIGALNWGLVAIFDFNFVSWITMGNNIIAAIIYIVVAVAGLWLVAYLIGTKGRVGIPYGTAEQPKNL